MYNCMFSAHCTENICDQACPILAETSYLLERNEIAITNKVFKENPAAIDACKKQLSSAYSKGLIAIESKKTVSDATLYTYCAICENWRGSQLHCTVYNLKFGKYLDMTKASWSKKQESPELEYMKIFMDSCKVLIISGLDYVNFKDFESQTLLTLLQSRMTESKCTIVISPVINNLIGDGQFFLRLKKELREVTV